MPSVDDHDEGPLAHGVLRMDRFQYRGKHYQVPIFDTADPVILMPDPERARYDRDPEQLVLRCLNRTWNQAEFLRPRRPVSLGVLDRGELEAFTRPGVPRVLDMPIKFPDNTEYRLPRALAQLAPTLQRVIDVEHAVNPEHAEYHAYLTVDQGWVEPDSLHREAPCHVDGFQGARWHPRCLTNHSYTVSDVLPTAYYVQSFDFTGLDERVHDYFWEMNAQVADTRGAHAWWPAPGEVTLMDCYCVHRGVEASRRTFRTWMRLSFEERRRIFDRLGNAHNPLFDYAWKMVERDIEALHLRAFREESDPSLRVFPWQALDGSALPPGSPKTKPNLR